MTSRGPFRPQTFYDSMILSWWWARGSRRHPPGADRLLWEELRALQPLAWGLDPPLGEMEQLVHVLGRRRELTAAFAHPW